MLLSRVGHEYIVESASCITCQVIFEEISTDGEILTRAYKS